MLQRFARDGAHASHRPCDCYPYSIGHRAPRWRRYRLLDLFERRVFEHEHLLTDVRKVDRHEAVTAGAYDALDSSLTPFRVTHAIPVFEAEVHACAGRFVNRDFAPAAPAGRGSGMLSLSRTSSSGISSKKRDFG